MLQECRILLKFVQWQNPVFSLNAVTEVMESLLHDSEACIQPMVGCRLSHATAFGSLQAGHIALVIFGALWGMTMQQKLRLP